MIQRKLGFSFASINVDGMLARIKTTVIKMRDRVISVFSGQGAIDFSSPLESSPMVASKYGWELER
jgi:hypothetical protein